MNYWTPTFHAWGEGFNWHELPSYLQFDYVEAYHYNTAKKEFEFAWRDDFNEFDQTRWHRASGTFEGNSSIFYPSNSYVANGNLVLKMEPSEMHIPEREHHEHYDRDMHHIRHGVEHMEHGILVHDAITGMQEPAALGHL